MRQPNSRKPSRLRPAGETGGTVPLKLGPLNDCLEFRLRRAHAVAARATSRVLAPLGATPGTMSVLALLEANPGLRQVDLADALCLDRSSLVPVVAGLRQRGLVAREPNPTDRRSGILTLTASGQQLLDACRRAVTEPNRRFVKQLGAARHRALVDALDMLVIAGPGSVGD